jgi:Aspartyl protease
LPIHTIRYAKFAVPSTPAFPNGRTAERPVVRVALQNGTLRLSCYAIVDSGADHCVFPRSFMQTLGLDPLTSPVEITSGVGNPSVPTHFAQVTLDLGVAQLPMYVGFTTGMDQLGLGLLGQTGFFESFKVTFDYKNRLFTIENQT